MSFVYILVILRYVRLHEGVKTRRNGTFSALKIRRITVKMFSSSVRFYWIKFCFILHDFLLEFVSYLRATDIDMLC